MNNKVSLFILGIILFYFEQTFTLIKGSESSISVLADCIFPEGEADNEMLGFGWFKNGFTLEDATTICSFNSIFPVSGTIDLRGGTLYLEQDLIFHNPTLISSFGAIVGNNHVVDFCSSITCLPSTPLFWKKTKLKLHEDLVVTSTMTFQGDCIIEGNGYTIDCSQGGLCVAKNGQLVLKNLKIKGISGTNMYCEDDTGTVVLDDVIWRQSGNATFDAGKIIFKNAVDFSGSYTFAYRSSQKSIISNNSQWKISDNMRLAIGKKTIDGDQPLQLTDATSKLYLDNCNFCSTEYGMQIAKGRVIIDHDMYLDIMSTSTSNGLSLGNGTEEGNTIVEIYPGGAARLRTGHLIYDITNPDAIKASSNSARFIRYDGTYYHIKQNVTLTDLLIYAADFSHISLDNGAKLAYENCLFARNGIECTARGSLYNAYTMLLDGDDYIFMSRGQLPLYSLIKGTNNKIFGSGIINGGITIYNDSSELTWDINGSLGNFLQLNDGLLILNSDLNCMNNVQLLGNGRVLLNSKKIKFGSSDMHWPGSIYWNGDNGVVDINSNITLSGTWTFSGNCIVSGQQHILDLNGGSLIVDRNSCLTLRNVMLHNVSGANIRCLDDSACIILDNVLWQQSNNFTFTSGSLQFKNMVELKGTTGTTFVYQSSQTSTVLANSTLDLEGGITFSYDPKVASKDLLEFVDNSSFLVVEDGSTLHAASVGMRLTKGTLRIKEEGYISSEVINPLDEGIILGNGNSDNDMILMVCPGVKVKLIKGTLSYNNVGATACYIGNSLSTLWLAEGTQLRLYQDLHYAPGIVHFDNNTTLARAADKTLHGEVNTSGILSYIVL